MRPDWLASTALLLVGLAMILIGHFEAAKYAPLLIFGVIVLALGITVSAYSGGVRNGLVLVGIFAAVLVVLYAVDLYDLAGLRGWI